MNIVVDTNILVRVLIAPDGLVADLYYPLKQTHTLFISNSSIEEINKHKQRLLRISGLKQHLFDSLLASLLSGVTIVPVTQIPNSIFMKSFLFISGLDYDDAPFVATALFVNGFLWTSDKELFYGLKKKGFELLYNNAGIKKLIKGN